MVRIVSRACNEYNEEGPFGTEAKAPPYFVEVGVELKVLLELRDALQL
jgi:hypothetical protein